MRKGYHAAAFALAFVWCAAIPVKSAAVPPGPHGSMAALAISNLGGDPPCPPSIEITTVPGYGSGEELCGVVHCVNPDSVAVATYIFVEGAGWWTKPTLEQPLTPVDPDSTWCVDIVTGGSDAYATRIHVVLLPVTASAPLCQAACELPDFSGIALAEDEVERLPRTVTFAGYTWGIKASAGPVGPGPIPFSDDPSSVWVDEEGLHLKLRKEGDTWYGSEVILRSSFGLQSYVFHLTGPLGELDENVVIGIFTWDNDDCPLHQEIDIEAFKDPDDTLNWQYVVQPWQTSGNRHRWLLPEGITEVIHSFDWRSDRVSFRSDAIVGELAIPQTVQSWTYSGPDAPTPGAENIRINIWLQGGNAPTNDAEVEIVVRGFTALAPASAEPVVEDAPNRSAAVDGTSTGVLSVRPSPFREHTRIEYAAPGSGPARIGIHAASGSLVRVITDADGSGAVLWDGADDHGRPVPAGIYFISVDAVDAFGALAPLIEGPRGPAGTGRVVVVR